MRTALNSAPVLLALTLFTFCLVVDHARAAADEAEAYLQEVIKNTKGVSSKLVIVNAEQELAEIVLAQKLAEEQRQKSSIFVEVGEHKGLRPENAMLKTEKDFKQAQKVEDTRLVKLRTESTLAAREDLKNILGVMKKRFCKDGGLSEAEKQRLEKGLENIFEAVVTIITIHAKTRPIGTDAIIRIASYLTALLVNEGIERFCKMTYPV